MPTWSAGPLPGVQCVSEGRLEGNRCRTCATVRIAGSKHGINTHAQTVSPSLPEQQLRQWGADSCRCRFLPNLHKQARGACNRLTKGVTSHQVVHPVHVLRHPKNQHTDTAGQSAGATDATSAQVARNWLNTCSSAGRQLTSTPPPTCPCCTTPPQNTPSHPEGEPRGPTPRRTHATNPLKEKEPRICSQTADLSRQRLARLAGSGTTQPASSQPNTTNMPAQLLLT
jgi:hypothetical protein